MGDLVKIYYVFKPRAKNLHDWAGQVDLDKAKRLLTPVPLNACDYEVHDMFAVTWDGRIAACCYDIEARVGLTVDDILENGFSFRRFPCVETAGWGGAT